MTSLDQSGGITDSGNITHGLSHTTACLKVSRSRYTKRITPTDQQTAIHYRTENHPIQTRLEPRGKILTGTTGFAKYYLNTTCEIPLNRIRIDREQKQISAQGVIVITTKPDGTLKFHKGSDRGSVTAHFRFPIAKTKGRLGNEKTKIESASSHAKSRITGKHEAAAHEESEIFERHTLTREESEILGQHTTTTAATNDEAEILGQRTTTTAAAADDDGNT